MAARFGTSSVIKDGFLPEADFRVGNGDGKRR